jgi:hypothetical protein
MITRTHAYTHVCHDVVIDEMRLCWIFGFLSMQSFGMIKALGRHDACKLTKLKA